MQITVPISSDSTYPIREEGLFIPDPTAPGYSGTYTLQAEYKIHQENRSTMQVTTPPPLTQPPEADIDKPLDSTTKLPLVRSQQPKQVMFQIAEMLTRSEIEQLRQEQKNRLDLLQKEFQKAKILRW